MFAKMTKTTYKINPNNVKQWVQQEIREESIDRETYDNIVDANNFFRSFGSERMYRTHTPQGYIVTKIVSTCPNRVNRVIRSFEII